MLDDGKRLYVYFKHEESPLHRRGGCSSCSPLSKFRAPGRRIRAVSLPLTGSDVRV